MSCVILDWKKRNYCHDNIQWIDKLISFTLCRQTFLGFKGSRFLIHIKKKYSGIKSNKSFHISGKENSYVLSQIKIPQIDYWIELEWWVNIGTVIWNLVKLITAVDSLEQVFLAYTNIHFLSKKGMVNLEPGNKIEIIRQQEFSPLIHTPNNRLLERSK